MPQIQEQAVPPLPGFFPAPYSPGPEAAEEFKDLMWLAQEQGYLTSIDIGEALGERYVRPEDVNAIRLTISKLDVKIVESPEFDAPATENGTPARPDVQIDGLGDPVKIYFRQMGQFSLLTPEREAELFGRIEAAARDIRRTMYPFGFMAREHLAIAGRLLSDPPGERIERVMVDARVESRPDTLAMLRRLVKQVRFLDAEAAGCFRKWREARSDERAKLFDEFQQANGRLAESFDKFSYNHKVLVELAALVATVRRHVESRKDGASMAGDETADGPPSPRMPVGWEKTEDIESLLRMSTRDCVRACRQVESHLASLNQARNQVVEGNLRLVIAIAKRHLHRGVSLLDLVQEGNIGLIKAVERFQHRRGIRFCTYAGWWIRHHMRRSIMDHARTIRIPAGMGGVINRLMQVEARLMQAYGRAPTAGEMADELDMPETRVRHLLQMSQPMLSLDAPLNDAEGRLVGDAIEDESIKDPLHTASMAQLRQELGDLVSSLTVRQRAVLEMRYGLVDGRARTLEEVGHDLKITRERVRQIEAAALKRMRHPERSRCLVDLIRA